MHATVTARWVPGAHGGWAGLMLTGPSGVGKSDLVLRLMGRGWRLVADDYAEIFASGGRLYARAPETVARRMEIRGLGVVDRCALPLTRLVLAVGCQTESPERMPANETMTLAGHMLPLIRLRPLEPSAADKAAAAFSRFRSAID